MRSGPPLAHGCAAHRLPPRGRIFEGTLPLRGRRSKRSFGQRGAGAARTEKSTRSDDHPTRAIANVSAMMLPPRLTALRPVAAAWLILAVVTTAAAVAVGGWDARGPIDGLRSAKLAAAMGLLTAVTLWPWVRWGRSPLAATWLIAAGSLLRVAGTVALFLVASYQWATPNSKTPRTPPAVRWSPPLGF